MIRKKFAELLGTCWVNYNSLETLTRLYLLKHNKESEVGLEINEGEACRETYLTNYMTLGQLFDHYNKAVPKKEFIIHHTSSILRFRDSMAHGRSLGKMDTLPLTVHKYSKPNSGFVKLEVKQVLSEEYLIETAEQIFRSAKLVQKAIESLI